MHNLCGLLFFKLAKYFRVFRAAKRKTEPEMVCGVIPYDDAFTETRWEVCYGERSYELCG